MKRIQVDMFPVGLGSAMILQFRNQDSDDIRILADGGVGRGISKYTVRDELLGNLALCNDSKTSRIDLIIGTHYDADHLSGLVPIIEDFRFDIGEVWLPPIVNDAAPPIGVGIDTKDSDLFVHQLYEETNDGEKLGQYRVHVAKVCEILLKSALSEFDGKEVYRRVNMGISERLKQITDALIESYERRLMKEIDNSFRELEIFLAKCQHHLKESGEGEATGGTLFDTFDMGSGDQWQLGHCDESWPYPPPGWDGKVGGEWDANVLWSTPPHPYLRLHEAIHFRRTKVLPRQGSHRLSKKSEYTAILQLMKGQARNAINASALDGVVKAIRSRNAQHSRKVSIQCHMIRGGIPKRFVWQAATRRFDSSGSVESTGPSLTVLAPSRKLALKHLSLLPTGPQGLMAMAFRYDLKWITPSNQLSYVVRAEYMDQGVLISGDTGLVDFVTKVRCPRRYHRSLIRQLAPLSVIQIAHHGGRNWYFYEVLMESRFWKRHKPAFLLLSHAVNDSSRPSQIFGKFVADLSGQGCEVSVLFTSQPRHCHVSHFQSQVHGPVGPEFKEGRFSISFDGHAWSVDKHAIKV